MGTLSYENFQTLARELVSQSNGLGDGWTLRTATKNTVSKHAPPIYLVKKSFRTALPKKEAAMTTMMEPAADEEDNLEELAGDTSGLVEDDDMATLAERVQADDSIVNMEYHIVHSVSYQVPLLYFNAAHSNGQSLSLPDIWDLVSPNFVGPEVDKWGVVTQTEHPLLGRPFYHIHPCHTATLMAEAMKCCTGSREQEVNYLLTWLSTIGPLVGLRCPLEYVTEKT